MRLLRVIPQARLLDVVHREAGEDLHQLAGDRS
jgi:hypothetical protein